MGARLQQLQKNFFHTPLSNSNAARPERKEYALRDFIKKAAEADRVSTRLPFQVGLCTFSAAAFFELRNGGFLRSTERVNKKSRSKRLLKAGDRSDSSGTDMPISRKNLCQMSG